MKNKVSNFLKYVNLLQGTNSEFDFSHGNCFPLISRPFGNTAWSPQTSEGNWIFAHRSKKLQGIRATHIPSPWVGDYGHFTIMPQTGPAMYSAEARSSSYKIEKSIFKPHYFKAFLERYLTTMELTPTERCALLRFTFHTADQARVILQMFDGESEIQIDNGRGKITGFTRANSGGAPENFACYFIAEFNRSFEGHCFFKKNEIRNHETHKTGTSIGFVAEFGSIEQVIEMKIATSFISIEQAKQNLQQEIADRSFEKIQQESFEIWNDALNRIQVDGGTEEQLRTFYSCFYRTQLFPRQWHVAGAIRRICLGRRLYRRGRVAIQLGGSARSGRFD